MLRQPFPARKLGLGGIKNGNLLISKLKAHRAQQLFNLTHTGSTCDGRSNFDRDPSECNLCQCMICLRRDLSKSCQYRGAVALHIFPDALSPRTLREILSVAVFSSQIAAREGVVRTYIDVPAPRHCQKVTFEFGPMEEAVVGLQDRVAGEVKPFGDFR